MEKMTYGIFYNRHHKRRGFRTRLEQDEMIKEVIAIEAENRKVPKERVYKERLRSRGYDTRALFG